MFRPGLGSKPGLRLGLGGAATKPIAQVWTRRRKARYKVQGI
jgi:hypothetical protein